MLVSRIGIIISFYLLLSACATNAVKQQELVDAHQNYFANFENNLHEFHREIDATLRLRKQSVEFYKQEILEGKSQYFNAQDIYHIQTTVSEYNRNRNALLYKIAHRYRKLIQDVELVLTLDKPSGLVTQNSVLGLGGKNTLYVNPNDNAGRQYIKVIKLGLASALTLYDNFVIAILPFHENSHFRKSINYDNLDNKKFIQRISGNFRKLSNYKDTLKVVEFNDAIQKWENQNPNTPLTTEKDISYFNVLINGSYFNKRIKEISLWDRISFRAQRFSLILRDTLFDASSESMDAVSGLFGNGMGLISLREGYLKSIPRSHKQEIEAKLLPGDILLEKTPFRLTDRFIPGHWGHVAIWVGTKEQLQELGVWDELPALYAKSQRKFNYKGPSFQSQILNNHKIVEALRPGVQINTLDHFLNIDDMAVLRDEKLGKKALKRYVVRAFEQVGKEYDFNFDVETDTKIVCSELAFVAYDDYKWPISKTAGRYTISPDHVAEKANGDGPFKPIMLYHDGKVVVENIQLNFNRLMQADYNAVASDLMVIN